MIPRFFCLFFFSFCLASCASQPTHWISRTEIHPALDANIKSIELVDGSILEFNRSLGWYDAEKEIIEGVTITGWHPAIPLAKVQRLEIADEPSGPSVGVILLILLVLSIGIGIGFLNQVDPGGRGCLILVQLAVVSAATMAAVVLIFL
jgi:hypothetical protein